MAKEGNKSKDKQEIRKTKKQSLDKCRESTETISEMICSKFQHCVTITHNKFLLFG